MTWTRRAFIAGSTAACIGCSSGSTGDGDVVATSSTSTTDPAVVDEPVPAPGPVDVGTVAEVERAIDDGNGFSYRPEARAWIVRIPKESLGDVEAAYGDAADAGMAGGFVALHQKCTHLGCRVPECVSSDRFECPCHGAVFNRIGEWVDGPAPRGLDRFAVSIEDGRVRLDLSAVIEGSSRGVLTISGDPDGPACIALDS